MVDPAWHDDWHRLLPLSAIGEGESARLQVDGVSIVARRHGGEIIAFRDPCPACRASLDAAILAHGTLRCPGCGATWPIDPETRGSLHLPVMIVDDVAYGFMGEPRAPGAETTDEPDAS